MTLLSITFKVLFFAWAGLFVFALLLNPLNILNSFMDIPTRLLWILACLSVISGIFLHIGLSSRILLILFGVFCVWFGWKVRGPRKGEEPSQYIVQCDTVDRLLGQQYANVKGAGIKAWEEGGAGKLRAFLHQGLGKFVTEDQLHSVGQPAYAMGYEEAKCNETKLTAKIATLTEERKEMSLRISHLEIEAREGYEYYEKYVQATHELKEYDSQTHFLQKELRETVSRFEEYRASIDFDNQYLLTHPEYLESPIPKEINPELEYEFGCSEPPISFESQKYTPSIPQLSRDEQIRNRVALGEKKADLAREYGLTPGRVTQICKALEVPKGKEVITK